MQEIIKRSNLSDAQLYQTFNMGMGMVLAIKENREFMDYLSDLNIEYKVIGFVEAGQGVELGSLL